MKKFLYFVALTAVFIGPMLWWIHYRHGLLPADITLLTFRRAVIEDNFLKLMIVVNTIMYFNALPQILFDGSARPKAPSASTQANTATQQQRHVAPGQQKFIDVPVQSNSTSNFEKAYGAPRPTQQSQQAAPQTQPATQAAVEELHVAQVVGESPSFNALDTSSLYIERQAQAQPAPTIDSNTTSLAEAAMRDMGRSRANSALEDKGYFSFRDIAIDGTVLDLVSIASDDVLTLTIVDPTFGEIVAVDKYDFESSADWYTTEKSYNSPVIKVLRAKRAVEEMFKQTLPDDHGIEIQAYVALPIGSISNAADMKDIWADMGVNVVRLDSYVDLPEFKELISDRADKEVFPDYKEYVETLIDYFKDKEESVGQKAA
ncbi:MAG: hypothetical protein FWD15_02115 [Alphaproteobacteria bacterium]|nr:hypothetical protein [Alphaproteobacteria bacterium]